ncbi:MAG TPA: hypothetical protein VK689_12000, partial [Armatimonadota bacterium]|nr:hypothetical protein [Armatimonadota bacterium]
IPAAAARALELQADRFAFELLFRIGTRLREEAVTAEGPLDEIATYEEWLVKAALGGLLVCGIFEVGERSCRKPAEQRSHPPAATRTIALITGLRAAMVEHLASAAGADAVLARVVRNAQRIYGLLGVPPLAENAMYAWMNRDSYTNEAISEYREAARILRDMRHELREDEAAVHSLFGVPHPDDESSGLLE